jgi:hypothetical protein
VLLRAFAGTFVAVSPAVPSSDPGAETVSVYDYRSDVRRYEARPPAGRRFSGLLLDADGILFAMTRRAGADDLSCGSLGWYSAAEPAFHPLPGSPCRGSLTGAGGRVVYQRGPYQPSELRAVNRTGKTVVVARFGGVDRTYGFDADARRTVFAVRRCDHGFDIVSVGVGSRPYRAGSWRCPAALLGPRRLVASGGRVPVGVRCPRGCRGVVGLYRGRRLVGRSALRHAGGAPSPVRVRLTRRGTKLLATRGAVPVVIRVVTLDRDVAWRKRRIARHALLTR